MISYPIIFYHNLYYQYHFISFNINIISIYHNPSAAYVTAAA